MDDIINVNGYTFKYNSTEEAYLYELNLEGNRILTKIYPEEDAILSVRIAAYELDNLEIDRIKEYIAINFYKSLNDELGISKQDFYDAIDLDVLCIDNKNLEYWFDDGNLLGGRSIVVSKTHETGKLRIDLMG